MSSSKRSALQLEDDDHGRVADFDNDDDFVVGRSRRKRTVVADDFLDAELDDIDDMEEPIDFDDEAGGNPYGNAAYHGDDDGAFSDDGAFGDQGDIPIPHHPGYSSLSGDLFEVLFGSPQYIIDMLKKQLQGMENPADTSSIEPKVLRERYRTQRDDLIRTADCPERFFDLADIDERRARQKRRQTLRNADMLAMVQGDDDTESDGMATEGALSAEERQRLEREERLDRVELRREARWILCNSPLAAKAMAQLEEARGPGGGATLSRILAGSTGDFSTSPRLGVFATFVREIMTVLDFLRNELFEVSFIIFYRRHYFSVFCLSDFWVIYDHDIKWTSLAKSAQDTVNFYRRIRDRPASDPLPSVSYMENMDLFGPIGAGMLMTGSSRPISDNEATEALNDDLLDLQLFSPSGVYLPTSVQEVQDLRDYMSHHLGDLGEPGTGAEDGEGAGSTGLRRHLRSSRNRSTPSATSFPVDLVAFVRTFAISGEQLGINLVDNLQHDAIPTPRESPLAHAETFLRGLAADSPLAGLTGRALLRQAAACLEREIFTDPRTRRFIRQLYFDRVALLNTRPTPAGESEIDEFHPFANFKFLTGYPAKALRAQGTFVSIHKAVTDNLLEVSFSDCVPLLAAGSTNGGAGPGSVPGTTGPAGPHSPVVDLASGESAAGMATSPAGGGPGGLRPDQTSSPILQELIAGFCCAERSDPATLEWNGLRQRLLYNVLATHFNPLLKEEIRGKLLEEARLAVADEVAGSVRELLNAGPYFLSQPDLLAEMREFRSNTRSPLRNVLSLARDRTKLYAAVVDEGGFFINGSVFTIAVERQHRGTVELDHKDLVAFIYQFRPVAIVIGTFGMETRSLFRFMDDLIKTRNIQTELLYVDGSAARLKEQRVIHTDPSLMEYDTNFRFAVHTARRLLDPLEELASLFTAQNDILSLRVHSLQRELPGSLLLDIFTRAFCMSVAHVGVDINRSISAPHFGHSLQFVPGLGPRKAEGLKLAISHNLTFLNSRDQLISELALGSCVYINCAALLVVRPRTIRPDRRRDSRDTLMNHFEVLDATRIHPESYELARRLAFDVLDPDFRGKMATEVEDSRAILAMWESGATHKLAAIQADSYGGFFRGEPVKQLGQMLKRMRFELETPFYETRHKFKAIDDESLFELLTSEAMHSLYEGLVLYAHVDRESDQGLQVRLPSDLNGFLPFSRGGDRAIYPRGSSIEVKVTTIDRSAFRVLMSALPEDIASSRQAFRSKMVRAPFFDVAAMEAAERRAREARVVKKPEIVRRMVDNNPNFHNITHAEAEEMLRSDEYEIGDFIIRPSSSGSVFLTITIKWPAGAFYHVLVTERDKQLVSAIGKRLIIEDSRLGSSVFEDLDDLTANWIEPFSMRLHELMEHKKFHRDLGETALGERLLAERGASSIVPYGMCADPKHPGYMLLLCVPHKSIVKLFIKITPKGYLLDKSAHVLDSTDHLLNSFKQMMVSRASGAGGRSSSQAPHAGGRANAGPGPGVPPGGGASSSGYSGQYGAASASSSGSSASQQQPASGGAASAGGGSYGSYYGDGPGAYSQSQPSAYGAAAPAVAASASQAYQGGRPAGPGGYGGAYGGAGAGAYGGGAYGGGAYGGGGGSGTAGGYGNAGAYGGASSYGGGAGGGAYAPTAGGHGGHPHAQASLPPAPTSASGAAYQGGGSYPSHYPAGASSSSSSYGGGSGGSSSAAGQYSSHHPYHHLPAAPGPSSGQQHPHLPPAPAAPHHGPGAGAYSGSSSSSAAAPRRY
ncbi:hypothetical protein H696_04388 [Fonticula alba]|uniref:Transcription elongation factor SPT6 n=1 Tax=Fonticula alba TaxID=691883 RepID=A0A058Z4Z5_FONAL|nr:hypothetical protein H696_04388 [Fonticula alba]KCV68968.1 hypothetical protein H696_04388 [Fonticula alba]|eukprot:XP_009496539.1 hypothetical protein H696_04388 [Fonticula alba]